MGLERVLEEYIRWRAYDYSHDQCLTALRTGNPDLSSIASQDDVDQAIRVLEECGDIPLRLSDLERLEQAPTPNLKGTLS